MGKVNLLGGIARFKNIEYALPGSSKLQDDMSVKFYYLGAQSKLAQNLTGSARYVKGKLDTPYFDADKYIQNDGYLFNLTYKCMEPKKRGSWDAYINYYDRGGQTYIAETQNIDTFGFANVAGMGLGVKGFCIGADYAIAKNITSKIEYYKVHAKVCDVDSGKCDDSYLCTQFFFTF